MSYLVFSVLLSIYKVFNRQIINLYYKCIYAFSVLDIEMAGFMNSISPSDPNGIYKLSKWCAMLGYVCIFFRYD